MYAGSDLPESVGRAQIQQQAHVAAIRADIFFIDDEPVQPVGDVLKAVYLQMSGVFGGVRFVGRDGHQQPNP